MEGRQLFWAAAALALIIHVGLLLSAGGLQGGSDLVVHLWLIDRMGDAPALRNVYAPGYHMAGALLSPLVGLGTYPRVFAFGSAAGLIFGFRFFQRAAGLPAASASVFALSPYALTLSYCIPKVEFAGHALGLVGLGLLFQRRYLGLALILPASFAVHTAATLVYGLAGGVLALSRRDVRALGALAAGSALAAPLFATHVAAGCSVPQALLFSASGYGVLQTLWLVPWGWKTLLALASPIALAAALVGAARLWRDHRPLAIASVALVLLYLSNLWLAPFGIQTAINLHRGLSVLMLPVAIAAGVAVADRRRAQAALIGACTLLAIATAVLVVPRSCHVRPISIEETYGLKVFYCHFAWRESPQFLRSGRPASDAGALPLRRPRRAR